jgi:Na+/proline symporter
MLTLVDWLIIVFFFAVLIVIGGVTSRRAGSSSKEFFLSGNAMPWWLLGISMCAATTSTNSANLFTEIIRKNGISGNWVWWAFLLTGMLTVFVYAKLWHRTGAKTDIEFYELRYSGKAAAFLRGFRALYLGVFFNTITTALVILGASKSRCDVRHLSVGHHPDHLRSSPSSTARWAACAASSSPTSSSLP